MNSSSLHSLRGAFSATVAAAIIGTSGLALDQGHTAAAPKGVVEVGELTPIDLLPQVAQLPGITVEATRIARASDHGRA